MIASQSFIRSTGKPEAEHLDFILAEEQDVCIVISTGTLGPDGELIEPASASLVASLGQVGEIVGPESFNAHPQLIGRLVTAAEIGSGAHSLAVELRGKPTSVAHVTVIAAASNVSGTSISGPTRARLENPSGFDTVVRDEAIALVTDSTSLYDVNSALASLPFPALAIGRLPVTPIYQIYLPGTDGGDGLRDRIAQIAELPGFEVVGPHRIGRAMPNVLFPQPGNDAAYVNAEGDGFTPDGWHLATVHADDAWATCNVESGADVVVLDNGFNPNLQGIANNVAGCLIPGASLDCANNPGPLAPISGACAADDEDCLEWQACQGGEPMLSHGQAIAGLIAAEGDTSLGGADTIGVVWYGPRLENSEERDGLLHLARIEDFQTFLASDPRLMELVDAMSDSGVNIVTMSYGYRYVCQNGDIIPSLRDEPEAINAVNARLNTLKIEDASYWGQILANHENLVIVAAAGNVGHICGQHDHPAEWCSTAATGYACAVDDPVLSKQVLCVAATTETGEFAAFSNRGGDRIAAPGQNLRVMTVDGGIATGSGTSFSAPLVAGAVSFARGINPSLTPAQLHDILVSPSDAYRLLNLEHVREQACTKQVFSDVPANHWAFKAINTLACECILEGCSDQQSKYFSPEQTINRVEALKVILELAFPLEVFNAPNANPYDDVDKDIWYARYVAFAKAEGILAELIGDGVNFEPATEVTRGEFMHLLVIAATKSEQPQYQMLSQTFGEIDSLAHEVVYLDLPTVGMCPNMMGNAPCHIYQSEIYAGTDRCVVSGYPDHYFRPNNFLNRAEAAKIACIASYGYGSTKCGSFQPCTPHVP